MSPTTRATAAAGAQGARKTRASKAQVARLVRLGKDYNRTVKSLPVEKQQAYAREHRAVVQAKRRAQADEGVLRIRVR